MDYYPIQLNLKGKQAVIIGGGKVAERKLTGLLHKGADLTIRKSRYHEQTKGICSKWKSTLETKDFFTR